MLPFRIALLLIASSLTCLGNWVNTEGFVMGQLSRVEREGASIREAVRGEILLGRESAVQDNHDGTSINPWSFCADPKLYKALSKQIGYYVVIQFKTPKKTTLLGCSGSHQLVNIWPVRRGAPRQGAEESDRLDGDHREGGVQFGRIVRTTSLGSLNPNYRLTLQVGNSGNRFEILGLDDRDLYDFANACMRYGLKVRVYTVKWLIGGAGTDFYAWRLEVADDL